MNVVFLMGPLTEVDPKKDTSFVFMMGAIRRGHQTWYLRKGGITVRNGKLLFDLVRVTPSFDNHPPFLEEIRQILPQEDVHAVFVRSDPPFDEDYLMHTWLLDLLPDTVPVINRPSGIRAVNEKIWASQFGTLVPRTVISRDVEALKSFLDEEGEVIAKPSDGFGGACVFFIKKADTNANVILETLTHAGTREIILQQYLHEAEVGDKRILLLNGVALGAVLRVHTTGEHRNNFFAGGKPEPAQITPRDEEIIATLSPYLRDLGLYFVGIDIIGDCLIEVNVTSPTCLQEINRLYGKQLEDNVIEFVEHLVSSNPS